MSSTIISAVRGLYLSPNELDVPAGALIKAENCVIRNDGVIEPRRGHKATSQFGDSSSVAAAALMLFQGNPILNYYQGGSTSSDLNKLARYVSGTYTTYSGTYLPPDDTLLRMKGLETQLSLFFTTSLGIYVLETLTGTPQKAGLERAGDPSNLALVNGTNVALAANSRVCYRVVWTRNDATSNTRLLVGAPSGFAYISNPAVTAATRDVSMSVPHLPGADSTYRIRVYRSPASSGESVPPPTDVYQVYEKGAYDTQTSVSLTAAGTTTVTATKANHPFHVGDKFYLSTNSANFPSGVYTVASVPTSSTWTYVQAGSVNATEGSKTVSPVSYYILDETSINRLGAPLYVNATDGEGELAANFQPPKANDLCLWQGRSWYGNTTSKQNFNLTMLGTGSPNGVQAGDTITIAGQTYTAIAPGTPTTLQFVVSASSSAAQALFETANNLIQAINQNPANTTVRAFNISSETDDLPVINIQEIGVGGSAFTVYASRVLSWVPLLTTGTTGALSSSNDRAPNRVFYSKIQQPEAVPLLNYVDVGAKDKPIYRVVANQDRLFVMKEDGIFMISGQAPFRVDLLDDTALPIAPDSFTSGNNSIFGLTTQGVVSITYSGVQIVSRQVEDDVTRRTFNTSAKRNIFGYVCEPDRHYVIALPNSSSLNKIVMWVYNYLAKAWTNWPFDANTSGNFSYRHAVCYKNNSYFAYYSWRRLAVDIPTYTNQDYADFGVEYAMTLGTGSILAYLAPISGSGVSLSDIDTPGSAFVDIADIETSGLISTIDPGSGEITVYALEGVNNTNVQVFNPIQLNVAFASTIANNPADFKHYRSVTFLFRRHDYIEQLYGYDKNDYSKDEESSAIIIPGDNAVRVDDSWTGWDSTNAIFLLSNREVPANKRILLAQLKQRSNYLIVGMTFGEALSYVALNGIELDWEPGSERGNR